MQLRAMQAHNTPRPFPTENGSERNLRGKHLGDTE